MRLYIEQHSAWHIGSTIYVLAMMLMLMLMTTTTTMTRRRTTVMTLVCKPKRLEVAVGAN